MLKRIHSLGAALFVVVLVAGCGGDDGLAADAGADFSINVGDSPTFDGCGSEGDIQDYAWTIIDAPSQMAGDAGKPIRETDPNCSFTLEAAMEVQEVGTWVVELTVTDTDGATSADTVSVEVGQ